MEVSKNLQIGIPNVLLMEAQKAAEAQHITVDELVRDAIERRLGSIGREKLFAYGEERALKLNIREEDVDGIIHQYREEVKEHGR